MGKAPAKPAIVVIEKATGKAIHRVEVTSPSESKVGRILRGMLINLDTEKYRLDVSEFAGLFGDSQ